MPRLLCTRAWSAWDYRGLPSGHIVLDGENLDAAMASMLEVGPCTVLWIGPADGRGLDLSAHIDGDATAILHRCKLLPQFEVDVRTSDYGDFIDRPVTVRCWSTSPKVPPKPTHGPLAGEGSSVPDHREMLRGNGHSIWRVEAEEWDKLRLDSADFVGFPLLRGLGFIQLPSEPPSLRGVAGLPAVLVAGGAFDTPGQWVPLTVLMLWSYQVSQLSLPDQASPHWVEEAWSELRRVPGRAFSRAWMNWAHFA